MDRREALAALAATPVSTITSVERVKAQPGEVIVVEMDEHITGSVADRIRAVMKQVFPGHECLVLHKGMRLKVVSVEHA